MDSRPEGIGPVDRGADHRQGAVEQGDASREEIREQSRRLIERECRIDVARVCGSRIKPRDLDQRASFDEAKSEIHGSTRHLRPLWRGVHDTRPGGIDLGARNPVLPVRRRPFPPSRALAIQPVPGVLRARPWLRVLQADGRDPRSNRTRPVGDFLQDDAANCYIDDRSLLAICGRLAMSWRTRPAGMPEHPTPRALDLRRLAIPSMREASIAARAAVNSLQTVSAICHDLIPLNMPMTDEQRLQRAKLIHSVLLTRNRMQLLRDRAEALAGALTRFRDRQGQIARRA